MRAPDGSYYVIGRLRGLKDPLPPILTGYPRPGFIRLNHETTANILTNRFSRGFQPLGRALDNVNQRPTEISNPVRTTSNRCKRP